MYENYDLYFIHLLEQNKKFEAVKNDSGDIIGYEKYINSDILIYFECLDEKYQINYDYLQGVIVEYDSYFKRINQKKDVMAYLDKILFDNFYDFLSLEENNQDYIWHVENILDFNKTKKEKNSLIDLFKDSESLKIYQEKIDSEYLKNKHTCLNPKCNSTGDSKVPCQSHYISNFVLKKLYTKNHNNILKLYPFDIIHDDISYSKYLYSDFILPISSKQNLQNTARIYCQTCDNKLAKFYETDASFFNLGNDNSKIIDSMSQIFLNFIKVKKEEFNILKDSLSFLNNGQNISNILIKREKEITSYYKKIKGKSEHLFNFKFKIEISDFVPMASMTFIPGNKIKKIFAIPKEYNLKNAQFKDAFLTINILPKDANISIITYDFINLSLADYAITKTFFLKNFQKDKQDYYIAKFTFTAVLLNLSEIFIQHDYFLNLSFNNQRMLINTIILKSQYFESDVIKMRVDAKNKNIEEYINKKLIADKYYLQEKISDLVFSNIVKSTSILGLNRQFFEDVKINMFHPVISFVNNELNQYSFIYTDIKTLPQEIKIMKDDCLIISITKDSDSQRDQTIFYNIKDKNIIKKIKNAFKDMYITEQNILDIINMNLIQRFI